MFRGFAVIVGSFAGFADSLRIFAEHGYDVYVVVISPTLTCFVPNYDLFRSLGWPLLSPEQAVSDAFVTMLQSKGYQGGMVISGPTWHPEGDIYPFGQDLGPNELDAFRNISHRLQGLDMPVRKVLCVNGETFFTSASNAARYTELTEPADLFVVHNPTLERYIKIHCPDLREHEFAVSPIHAPLGRDINTMIPDRFVNRILHLGRLISTRLPALPFSLDAYGMPPRILHLAQFGDLPGLTAHRRKAFGTVSHYRAGLGHFYDYGSTDCALPGAATPDEILRAHAVKQNIPMGNNVYTHPAVFRLTNVAGKVLTYLMLGLPPIVPADPDNGFHAMLSRRGMCLRVGGDVNTIDLSDENLRQIRANIAGHASLFTFDATFRLLDDQLRMAVRGGAAQETGTDKGGDPWVDLPEQLAPSEEAEAPPGVYGLGLGRIGLGSGVAGTSYMRTMTPEPPSPDEDPSEAPAPEAGEPEGEEAPTMAEGLDEPSPDVGEEAEPEAEGATTAEEDTGIVAADTDDGVDDEPETDLFDQEEPDDIEPDDIEPGEPEPDKADPESPEEEALPSDEDASQDEAANGAAEQDDAEAGDAPREVDDFYDDLPPDDHPPEEEDEEPEDDLFDDELYEEDATADDLFPPGDDT